MEFSSGRKRVIDELTRGRELIDHLRVMLNGDGALEQPVAVAEGLVEKLLDTFDESLSILSSTESDEVSRFPAVNWDGRKSGDSSKSCNTFESKDRRGRYKRRRTSETWIKDSPTQFEDGHAWRKYGQKVILNAKYPRSYLRCTHKYDQGCQASKQVQQIEDDPPMYRTTYIGHHICNKPSEIMTVKDSSIIMNFGSGSGSTSPKPIADYIVPHHALANFSSGGDRGDVISSDVYSCTASTHSISMDTDMMVDSLFDVLPEF